MIDKNLGKTERIVRFVLGIGLGYWAFSQPHLTLLEMLVLLAALFLILNGIFSRCYLWHVLGFDTCKEEGRSCQDNKACDSTTPV